MTNRGAWSRKFSLFPKFPNASETVSRRQPLVFARTSINLTRYEVPLGESLRSYISGEKNYGVACKWRLFRFYVKRICWRIDLIDTSRSFILDNFEEKIMKWLLFDNQTSSELNYYKPREGLSENGLCAIRHPVTISCSDLLNNRKNLSKFFNKKYSKGERLHLVSEIYDVTCFFLIKCHYFPHRSTKLFQKIDTFSILSSFENSSKVGKKKFFSQQRFIFIWQSLYHERADETLKNHISRENEEIVSLINLDV